MYKAYITLVILVIYSFSINQLLVIYIKRKVAEV